MENNPTPSQDTADDRPSSTSFESEPQPERSRDENTDEDDELPFDLPRD